MKWCIMSEEGGKILSIHEDFDLIEAEIDVKKFLGKKAKERIIDLMKYGDSWSGKKFKNVEEATVHFLELVNDPNSRTGRACCFEFVSYKKFRELREIDSEQARYDFSKDPGYYYFDVAALRLGQSYWHFIYMPFEDWVDSNREN